MGSAFAGVKAGILAGIFFAGSIGVFNYLLLLIQQSAVVSYLTALPECGGLIATNSTHVVQDCYSTVLYLVVPLAAFQLFVAALIFAFIFGYLFDRFPGRRYMTKALTVTAIMFVLLFLFGREGVSTNETQFWIVLIFDLVASGGFAFILARLYRRYTRVVEFQSQDPGAALIMLGKRNVTGKTVTLATRSSYRVVADVSGTKLFKEWSYTGGVTVEDPKSYETVLRVDGDGMLKALSTWST